MSVAHRLVERCQSCSVADWQAGVLDLRLGALLDPRLDAPVSSS